MALTGVIGAGSWGTALALLLHHNGHRVTLWSALADEVTLLQTKRENPDKLPGVKLPEDMKVTADLREAVSGQDMLVLAVPSPFVRSTAHQMRELVSAGQIIDRKSVV